MAELFLTVYRFFRTHKVLLYAILIGTTVVFGFLSLRIRFEENILKLLPQTSKSRECEAAFGDIKVKDKIFIGLLSRDGGMSASELGDAMDSFLALLEERDSRGCIANCFSGLDTDDLMNIVYYGMDALPCHLNGEFYQALDTLLCEATFDAIAAGGILPGMSLPDMGGYAFADGHLFSKDTTLALAFISPSYSTMDTKTGNQFETVLADCVRDFEEMNPDCEVLYHGTGPEGTYNSRRIRSDLVITVGISLALIFLILLVCLKSRRTVLHVVSPIAYGILLSLAAVYLIKGEISIISMGIGAIVMGVAMSYCLHVIIHHKFVSDVEDVIREQAKPVCLGCITTIGAFAGLLLTSSELLQDFGMFASFAMAGTTLFTLIFLPHFFSPDDREKSDRAFRLVNRINSYPLDRNVPIVIALAVVVAVCIFASGGVKFDTDLAHIGYREPKIVRSEAVFNDKVFGGRKSVFYAAHASTLDSAIAGNRALSATLDSLKGAGLIESCSGVGGVLVPYDEQLANIGYWKSYWTERRVKRTYDLLTREAEKRGWYQTTGFDIPGTFRLMAYADYEPQSLCDAGVIPEALLCNFVESNDSGWLVFSSVTLDKANLGTVNSIVGNLPHAVVLDPFFYAGDMVEIAHDDFNVVLLVSSIFVLIVLLVSFRSIVLSLIAFMPMFLSWYVVQGMMAIFGIQFNLINIMISSFVFGIGVDYSIFVMEGLVSRYRFDNHRLLVCHKAAIFFSGVTLIIVMASLLFAKHPAIHSIGISSLIGMTSTILITYAFQPILFRLATRSRLLLKETGLDKYKRI